MGRYTNKCEICDKFKSHKQTCRNCESTEATWEISLDCQCPHCKKYIDIFDQWHTHEMYDELNVGESKELSYWVVDCPICNEQFYIEEARY